MNDAMPWAVGTDGAAINRSVRRLAPQPTASDLDLHARLCDPELATRRLGELVPLLKFIGFRIEEITPERTLLTAPLLESAMNQNGTHQASVFYLLADYALGIGMLATLPGCYTVGVHDRCAALPVQFWLRSGRVTHFRPGTGTIRAQVRIPSEKIEAMRAAMVRKGRCEITHTVDIFQGKEKVAEAEHCMGLYADLPRVEGERASLTQIHSAKTSALMIAGLRSDAFSQALAQDQGRAIAQRMTRDTPQLPAMVAARSRSVEQFLHLRGATFDQVVMLGVGLDTKPMRRALKGQRWFLCDMPEMLKERSRRISEAGLSEVEATPVGLDFRTESWPDRLRDAGFRPELPTFFVLEGVSMYLEPTNFRKMLGLIADLCSSPESVLWLDRVTQRLHASDAPEVGHFLDNMQRLGEPFVNCGDCVTDMVPEGWAVLREDVASDFVSTEDPVFEEYVFALIRSATSTHPRTEN